MPRTGTSAPYANARTSPLPLNRDPSRGDGQASVRDRMRIWVDPSVPAASTTTSANTNEVSAEAVAPVTGGVEGDDPARPPAAGRTVRTGVSQKISAPGDGIRAGS